jgi:hypothetical protein
MNDQSPPKRVTRARAAAKTDDAGVKTTKIATAASKAKLTRAVSTTKRKTRAEDTREDTQEEQQEEDELNMKQIIEPESVRATRGRAKKVTTSAGKAPEAPAPTAPPPARGRPKKTTTDAPATEPTRSLRGRPKKIDVVSEEAPVAEEPAKRPTRARATTVTKPSILKKSVKFEEPDKENIVPAPSNVKGKAKVADSGTGLRAKPVRKPPTTVTARTTRGRVKSTAEGKSGKISPLSPKKATQVSVTREQVSEDELATNEKTPMKPLMKSPVKPPGSIFNTAKKLDFSNSLSVHRATTQDLGASITNSPARRPPQSPFKPKETLFNTSAQKSTLGNSAIRGTPFKLSLPKTSETPSAFRASLLQSPARKPQSPTKVTENGSPTRSSGSKSLLSATPKVSTLKMTKIATPRTLNKSLMRPVNSTPAETVAETAEPTQDMAPVLQEREDSVQHATERGMKFTGRLSSIVPRDSDPTSTISEDVVSEEVGILEADPVLDSEAMVIDEATSAVEDEIVVEEETTAKSNTPPDTPSRYSTGTFTLPEGDDNPFEDSDSEDELASGPFQYGAGPFAGFRSSSHDLDSYPSTPTPFTAILKTPRTSKSVMLCDSTQSAAKDLGFTPLARQLSDWMAASPVKSDSSSDDGPSPTGEKRSSVYASMNISADTSPVKSTYFDDEMSVRGDLDGAPEPEPESMEMDILEENFTPVELDEEDLDLANEADEMSLLEPDEIEAIEAANSEQEPASEADDLAPSEASQEYGDENNMPIDPALLALSVPRSVSMPTFTTPKHILTERVCHTVSKVPLKPAADDTPMRPSSKKRSASISRLPVQRPSGNLKRSSTVISYSPTESTPRSKRLSTSEVTMQDACFTPTKEDTALWSTLGTPPRTPRRDVNTALLKGAVVYVDVHTTEGADASVLFNELLVQMGARCVKSWTWNGSAEDGAKIGITHVVFKDGGKRTLEKVRETGGVVSCVGVGWVLE